MAEPKRILHVLAQRPSGGIGTFLYNMHSNIDTSVIQFDYLICDAKKQGDFDDKVKALGGKVYVLSPIKYVNAFRYIYELWQFFKAHREYSIVHGHLASTASIYLYIAKHFGIPHRIIHSHNTKYSDYRLRGIRNYILQIPLKQVAEKYFACSLKAGRFLYGDKLVNENKVVLAQNAVDTTRFRFNAKVRSRLRQEMGLENKLVLGHVGAFSPQKNHSFLIDIFNEIHKRNSNAVLLLLGKGNLEQEIKEKVSSLGLGHQVYFLGHRPNVHELMQAFDIFILPSVYEGLPLVGIEAQAAGLKCFISDSVTDELNVTDLVENISLTLPPAKWAEKILNSYSNHSRQDTFHEINNKGYDVKNASKRLQNFYLQLV